jgi:hypothetical protein
MSRGVLGRAAGKAAMDVYNSSNRNKNSSGCGCGTIFWIILVIIILSNLFHH